MEKDENDIKKNEQENVNSQVQENTTANKRMAQTSLKGAAAVAGAYVGGSTGAVIGSKAADVINNSKVGDAITDAAAQVGNVANKMSPTGKTNQKLTNAVANSGVLDLVDKGIDASAANYSPSPKSKIPDKTAKKTSLNESNNPAKKKENTPTIGGKNPSRNKYNDTIKKHSNHADGSNDYSPSKESRDSRKYAKIDSRINLGILWSTRSNRNFHNNSYCININSINNSSDCNSYFYNCNFHSIIFSVWQRR